MGSEGVVHYHNPVEKVGKDKPQRHFGNGHYSRSDSNERTATPVEAVHR